MLAHGGPISGTSRTLASNVFGAELQERFAALSGDRNPMHMDAIAARRTPPGSPVVHGIHTLLWALEALSGFGCFHAPPTRIRVRFPKWAYLDDLCTLSIPVTESIDPSRFVVDVRALHVLSAQISYEAVTVVPTRVAKSPSPLTPMATAKNLAFSGLIDCSGDAFVPPEAEVWNMFPRLTAILGAVAVGEIAACSYVVGMEVPGLQSMFSGLELTITAGHASWEPRTALRYRVSGHDERFQKIRIAVSGRSVDGSLDAFVRPPPVQQAKMSVVSQRVVRAEFVGMNALIIGGSRGLGEATAKIIAAGGGKSMITYAQGKNEAERVAEQIRTWGGNVGTLAYDVCRPPQDQLRALPSLPTHLFYFATSQIFRPKQAVFSRLVLANFIGFYLEGFYELCTFLTDGSRRPANMKLIAFYPSTVFIESRPPGMAEYAMIKVAGEELCRDMNQHLPNLHVISSRLPKLPTDQTAGILPDQELDPIAVLLPIVREMMGPSRS